MRLGPVMMAVGGAGAGVTVTATVQVAVRFSVPAAVMVYVVLAVGDTVTGPFSPVPETVGENVTRVALVVAYAITTGEPGEGEMAGAAEQAVMVGAAPGVGPGPPPLTVTVAVAVTEPFLFVAVNV